MKDGGKNWTDILTAAQIPPELQESLKVLRDTVEKILKSTGKDMKKRWYKLVRRSRKNMYLFVSLLANYGVFIVPFGELESRISYLKLPQNKQQWIVKVFDKLSNEI